MAQKKSRAERKTAQTYRGRCHRGATATTTTSTLQNVGKTTKSTRETKGKRGNKTERCVWHTSGVAAAAAGGPLPRAGSPATPSACAAQAHTRKHMSEHAHHDARACGRCVGSMRGEERGARAWQQSEWATLAAWRASAPSRVESRQGALTRVHAHEWAWTTPTMARARQTGALPTPYE